MRSLRTLSVPLFAFVLFAAPASAAPDPGYADWPRFDVDVNGDGVKDYCRYVGAKATPFLSCRLMNANGTTKDEYGYQHKGDQGFRSLPRMMGDVNGDRRADFCRFGGVETSPVLKCRLAGPTQWNADEYEFGSSGPIDPGYANHPRELKDRNGDGRMDYCRYVGASAAPDLACNYAEPTRFAADFSYRKVPADPGWSHLPTFNVDIDGDGLKDYCRYVGDKAKPHLSCRLLAPDGSTKDEYAYQHRGDQGFSELPRMMGDVDGNGRADFCRFVSDLARPQLMCRLAGATDWMPNEYGFGTDAMMDPGYNDLARGLKDGNNDGKLDYCRWVGVREYPEYVCNYSDGTKFAVDYSDRLQVTRLDAGAALATGDKIMLRSTGHIETLVKSKLGPNGEVIIDWSTYDWKFVKVERTMRLDPTTRRVLVDRDPAALLRDDLFTVEVLPIIEGYEKYLASGNETQKVFLKGSNGKYVRFRSGMLEATADTTAGATVLLLNKQREEGGAEWWQITVPLSQPAAPQTTAFPRDTDVVDCGAMSFDINVRGVEFSVTKAPITGLLLGQIRIINEPAASTGGATYVCFPGHKISSMTLHRAVNP